MMFAHLPLQSSRQEVRLLTLEPGDSGAPVRLQIQTAVLRVADDYTCLSYAWGPPSPTRSVQLNGCPYEVRESVYLALERLRLKEKPRRLWIDALCINQDDVKEREAQVSIMQHIYHSATDVIAWIGEVSGPADTRAIEFIRELGARTEASLKTEPGPAFSAGKETVDWLESVTPLSLANSIWLDVAALLERPWFSRIWIVQEVVMGKEVTVQCGPHIFPWRQLFACALFVTQHGELIASLANPDFLEQDDKELLAFYTKEQPLKRLLRAAANILSIGYLSERRRLQRTLKSVADPAIKQYVCTLGKHEPPGRLWGLFSEELHALTLYCAPSPGNPLPTGVDINHSTSPNPIEDPLRNSQHARRIYAMVNNIPIFTEATTSTRPSHPIRNKNRNKNNRPFSNLYNLISRFRPFAATDPRDKVYALLGVASEVENLPTPLPSISYHPDTSVKDVLWEVIAAHLRSREERHKLSFHSDACGITLDAGRPAGYPSWMPLWHDDGDDDKLAVRRGSVPVALHRLQEEPCIVYRAGGKVQTTATSDNTDTNLTSMFLLDKASGTLSVKGVVLGEVSALTEVLDQDAPLAERSAVMRRWAEAVHSSLGAVQKLNHVLTALRVAERISDEEAQRRLEEALGGLPPGGRELYNRFLATVMAAVSDEGSRQLVRPPAETGCPAPGRILVTGSGRRLRNLRQSWEMNMNGRIGLVCHGRRLFVSDRDHGGHKRRIFGLCPGNTCKGDMIALFLGSGVLHVVRKIDVVESQPIFGLVGEAYVQGLMDEELVEKWQGAGLQNGMVFDSIRLR